MGSCNSLKLLLKIRWRSTFVYKVSYQVLSWVLHQRRIQKPYYMTQEALWENILRRVFTPCHVCYACQHANMQKAWKLLNFTCQRAKKKHATLPKVCQFFNLACQRAKGLPIFQLGVPTCQKACQFFYYFLSEKVFQFSNFSIMLNICKSQEYLENSRKFIWRIKEFKFWNLRNFIKEMQN